MNGSDATEDEGDCVLWKIAVPLIIVNLFLLEAIPELRHNGISDGPVTETQNPPYSVQYCHP